MKVVTVQLEQLRNDPALVRRLATSKRPRCYVVDASGNRLFRLWIPSEPLR